MFHYPSNMLLSHFQNVSTTRHIIQNLTIKSCISDGQLYTATVADFSGTDPLIYREPLRTERSDLKQLNGNYFHLKTHLSYPVSIFMKLNLSDVQGIMDYWQLPP